MMSFAVPGPGARALAVLPVIACSLWAVAASAHPIAGSLYEGPAPGPEAGSEPRVVIERGEERQVYNTSQPVYEVYLPRPERASGAAVLMLPGGGLRVLGTGASLHDEIDALVAQGVAVMLLEYRTKQLSAEEIERMSAPPPPSAGPMRFPKMEIVRGNANPAPDDPEMRAVLHAARTDAQTALRLLHARSHDWNIDPERIGVMGTSAGGGVGFATLLADAPAEEKPDFLISIFGPSLQDVVAPETDAPPLFLVTEADHGPVTDGLMAVFNIWNDAEQHAELHIYDVPNFSMTVDLWGDRLFDWMHERAILPPEEPLAQR